MKSFNLKQASTGKSFNVKANNINEAKYKLKKYLIKEANENENVVDDFLNELNTYIDEIKIPLKNLADFIDYGREEIGESNLDLYYDIEDIIIKIGDLWSVIGNFKHHYNPQK
jgi:hypothetical protein